jgi:hypothetical protein
LTGGLGAIFGGGQGISAAQMAASNAAAGPNPFGSY